MPPQDLPPGLYDHPHSEAIYQALAAVPEAQRQQQQLAPTAINPRSPGP